MEILLTLYISKITFTTSVILTVSSLSKICLCYLIILNFINHRMRGLGVRSRRLWSLGGALRGFLRLDLRAQLMRGPGVQGSR